MPSRSKQWGGSRQALPADLRVCVRCARCGSTFFEADRLRYRHLTLARKTALAAAAVHAQTQGHDTALRAALYLQTPRGEELLPRACTRWKTTVPYVNPRDLARAGSTAAEGGAA